MPATFAGWELAGPIQPVKDATHADPTDAAVLKEYGWTGGAIANYARGKETLALRAWQFSDLSGAFGAYTYYRKDGWPKEEIGSGGSSDNNRVLFWVGNTVVDATFSHVGVMSASELRELAKALPVPDGNKALAPPVMASLPQPNLNAQTTHYALGPLGYSGSGGVLPPELVGFDRGAETVTATYGLRSGPGVLTLIDYPTPQMAIVQEKAIREFLKAGIQAQKAGAQSTGAAKPWPQPLLDSDTASLEVRRSGPIVVVVSGDAVPDEAHRLIESVHYEADFVSIPQPMASEGAKTYHLFVGIATLVAVGGGAAILLGLFLGGGRAFYRKLRGKPMSTLHESEFTSLHLRDEDEEEK